MTRPPLQPHARAQGLGITLIRQIMGKAPADAINLGIGQVDGDVPPHIHRALQHASSAVRAPYGPTPGWPPLVRRIADRYGVDPAQVIVTVGVEESLAVTVLTMAGPGDHVLVPDPAFPVYETMTRIAGATPDFYTLGPEEHFRPTWDRIAPHIHDRTRLVMLCSPGNPTGAVATPEEWARIGRELDARNIPWLSDEIYLDLEPEGSHPTMYAHTRRGFITSGFSKSHALAGWRLGWLVSPAELAGPITAMHQYLVTSAASPLMEAAMAAFTEEGEAACHALGASLRERRQVAIDAFTAIGFEVCAGDGAFYLFLRHPGAHDDLRFVLDAMEHARVILIPGRAFGRGGEGFLRLSYAPHPDRIREAADRLGAWLATLP
jgi:aminotransferase